MLEQSPMAEYALHGAFCRVTSYETIICICFSVKNICLIHGDVNDGGRAF